MDKCRASPSHHGARQPVEQHDPAAKAALNYITANIRMHSTSQGADLSGQLPRVDAPSDSDDEHQRPRNLAFAHAVPPPSARPDKLEGLLFDPSDDVDALAQHGSRRAMYIPVFGFDLFGHAPAIKLPE